MIDIHSSEPVPDSVTGCLEACRRCEAVVAAVLEQAPEAYSAVGPHLRHCIDHFRLLLDGWPKGVVDYDARTRDPRLEQDPGAVREALRAIASSLSSIRVADLARKISISQSVVPGGPPSSSPSCLDRELAFLSGHTIHHIAIMVLTGSLAGVEIPARLAVAYSTEAHRESLAMNR